MARPHVLLEQSDGDLVRRVQAGDSWAQEALFRKHVGFLKGLSVRLLGRSEDADDVVQDAFVAALDGIGSLREPESFRSWLAGIAVHKVHRRFRRRRVLRLLGLYRSSHDALLEVQASPGTPLEARDELRHLDAALARLPDVDRAAWVLRYVEGYSLEETAALCDSSLTTVKRRITRAHRVIRASVEVEEAHR